MKNPYYRPEEMDLEIIASIEYSSGNYEFDTRVVWKHIKTGEFYTMRDSGCSCPTPFESYDSLNKLDKLTDLGILRTEIQNELRSFTYITPEIAQEFLKKVNDAMKDEAKKPKPKYKICIYCYKQTDDLIAGICDICDSTEFRYIS